MTDTAKTNTPTEALASGSPEDGTHTFTLDGREVSARKGELLIAAAERAGTYIPRFCYHPRMEPVGMCRMCLVEVEGPRGATLQPACFIEAGEGMVVDTTSEKVKKAQDGVLEFLLANHPLDCPVCDKGGECPLQDQTLAYGPGESRFVEEKRHFEKPIAISDLVLLDRERCIQCARCTRFASEVAGEAQIDFAGRGEAVEVADLPDRALLLLLQRQHRADLPGWRADRHALPLHRPALGPRPGRVHLHRLLRRLPGRRAVLAEPPHPAARHRLRAGQPRLAVRQGPLRLRVGQRRRGRQRPRGRASWPTRPSTWPRPRHPRWSASAPAAGQFLGEARETGRFEHGRLVEPRVRKDGELVAVSWGEALAAAAAGLAAAKDAGGAGAVALIGGARLTNESAYAWAKLAKGVIGTDSVDAQLGDGLPADLVLGLPRATIDEACAAPVLLTLAGDLREELPVLFLRLREAVVSGDTQLLEIAPAPTALSALATASLRIRPGDAPLMARAVTGDAAAATTLSSHPEGAAVTPDQLERAGSVLAAHPGGEGVVVVAGRPSYAESGEVAAEAVRVAGRRAAQGDLPAGAAPGQRLRGARHGPGAGHPARAGSASMRAASASPPPGARCPRPTGLDTADILASMAGEGDGDGDGDARAMAGAVACAPSCSWAPTRSTTSPTAPWPRRRSAAGTSWSPSPATRPSRSTRTPTSCCPAR